MKQYLPLKPTKRGINVWVVVESQTGYFLDLLRKFVLDCRRLLKYTITNDDISVADGLPLRSQLNFMVIVQ